MPVSFRFEGWDALMTFAAAMNTETVQGVREDVKTTTDETQLRIQAEMPVDTGWAQARWGEPAYGGVYEERDSGLTIEHGSSIEPYEYIERLNEGYSQQAPAGFIDVNAENAERTLQEKLDARFGKLES
jgi:hypothetical protein